MPKTRSQITDAAAAFLEAGRTADRERAARHRHPSRVPVLPPDDDFKWPGRYPFPTL